MFKLILILSKTTKPFLEPENNMSSEEEEKPNLESNSLDSKDYHEEQTSLNSTVLANSTLSQVPEGIDTFKEIEQLKQGLVDPAHSMTQGTTQNQDDITTALALLEERLIEKLDDVMARVSVPPHTGGGISSA